MAEHHVINHVFVMSIRLIMHTPSAIHYLKTALLNKLTYLILHVVRLLPPPHAEELHFNVGELLVGISYQLINHCVYYQLHACLCDILIRASEVLVHSFEPSHIIMRVSYHVHGDLSVPVPRFKAG